MEAPRANALPPANRRQCAVPDPRRRRGHGDLPAQPAGRAGADRHAQPVHRLPQPRKPVSTSFPAVPNFAPYETDVKAAFRPGRLLWEQTGLAREASATKLDVLFSPGFTMPYFGGGGARVTVIHDLQHRRQPQNFGPAGAESLGILRRNEYPTVAGAHHRLGKAQRAISSSSTAAMSARSTWSAMGWRPSFFGLRENESYEPGIPASAGLPDCRYLLAVSHRAPAQELGMLAWRFCPASERGAGASLGNLRAAGEKLRRIK